MPELSSSFNPRYAIKRCPHVNMRHTRTLLSNADPPSRLRGYAQPSSALNFAGNPGARSGVPTAPSSSFTIIEDHPPPPYLPPPPRNTCPTIPTIHTAPPNHRP